MSLVEVAKVAGVSKSTVSRVVNQMPGVTAEVRQAVLEAMEKVGYQPSARRPGPKPASRQGIRTGNVLLLVLGFTPHELYRMPVFPAVLHGVEAAIRDAGLFFMLAGYHPDEALPAALNGDQVDGVLLLGKPELTTPALRAKLASVPGVGLFRGFEEVSGLFDRVLYNNAAVGRLAADYLFRRDHKHAAFINLDPEHPAFRRRRDDFHAAMAAGGGDTLDLTLPQQPRDPREELAEVRKLVDRLKAAKPKVTAVCTATDAALPPLYQALEAAGLKPVRDVDIVSCDNEEQFISKLSPRPATIDIRPELVGRQAIRQLLWRLGNRDEKSRITVLIEPVLIEPE